MSKRQLIDSIRELNPTARPTFLSQFEADELQQYLDHLRDGRDQRLHIAGWVRQPSQHRKVS